MTSAQRKMLALMPKMLDALEAFAEEQEQFQRLIRRSGLSDAEQPRQPVAPAPRQRQITREEMDAIAARRQAPIPTVTAQSIIDAEYAQEVGAPPPAPAPEVGDSQRWKQTARSFIEANRGQKESKMSQFHQSAPDEKAEEVVVASRPLNVVGS